MDNKKILKRKLLAISASLVIATAYFGTDHVYHPNYEIIAENPTGAFARYRNGYIYIGNKTYLASLKNIQEGDILVEDQRFNQYDPNMKIYYSYQIDDKEIRNEIIEVLCKYEEYYPSPWNRTKESMRLEWYMHNVSYFFEHQPHRTRDVDLDNNEEEYYTDPLLSKILKL